MPQGKRDVEKMFHAQLPAQVPASSAARISRWHRKAGVNDAVPGREDGKDAETRSEMQPPKANGGMQILVLLLLVWVGVWGWGVEVWKSGSVEVWKCGSVEVWKCGSVGMWVCVGVWVWGCGVW